jgi:hypothetical protein
MARHVLDKLTRIPLKAQLRHGFRDPDYTAPSVVPEERTPAVTPPTIPAAGGDAREDKE